MYQSYRTVQSVECLCCHEKVQSPQLLISYIHCPPICGNCIEKFEILYRKEKIRGIPVLILYEYNSYFRGLLYQYKGSYDLELKKVFLAPFLIQLKKKYKGYIIVPAPSSQEANRKRGFAPMKELAGELGLEVVDCLYKIDEYKQSDQSYVNRSHIQSHICIKNTPELRNKNIIFLDDVTTSHYTLFTCVQLIQTMAPAKVCALVLSVHTYSDPNESKSNQKRSKYKLKSY